MRYFRLIILTFAVLGSILSSCTGRRQDGIVSDPGVPKYLSVSERDGGSWTVVSVSPFDGSTDTLVIDRPMTNLIVMSTSHIGFLDALDRRDVVSGVSGIDYVYSESLLADMASSGGSTASHSEAPPLASLRSAPVPPLNVPRVAVVSPSRLASSAHNDDERVELEKRELSEGLAGPDRGRPPHARGRGPDRRRGKEYLYSGTLQEMGGAERSEESGLPGPSDSRVSTDSTTPVDVGFEGAPDYEKIVDLRPDVVLTYAVSGAESPFRTKLKQLGIRVFTVNEHLESHPLARASYIRLFGALTGEMEAADSVLEAVRTAYTALADSVAGLGAAPRKVLLNIPYNDQWFVPSDENYLTVMIRDAGGEVLGCEEGRAESSVMSVEKAYSLSKDADCWLNVGWCNGLDQLLGVNPIFPDMFRNIRSNASGRGYGEGPVVWNDNKRVNVKGGNDIWQSGVARPDLVLRDLVSILRPGSGDQNTIYYKPIN